MNNVREMVQASRTASDPGSSLGSDPMLAELLALNEEMVEQLRLELCAGGDSVTLITSMIKQHENAAEMLRQQLEKHRASAVSGAPLEKTESLGETRANGHARPLAPRSAAS